MGRVPLILGLILLVVGIGGATLSSWSFRGLLSTVAAPPNVCRPGERHVPNAASDSRSPGEAMRMFCVDAQGARRDVTGDYIVGMANQSARMAERMMPLAYGFLYALLAACGLLLVLLGLRARSRATTPAAKRVHVAGDLADRLRQIADARAANLISQAEHDRLRDEILRATATAPRA